MGQMIELTASDGHTPWRLSRRSRRRSPGRGRRHPGDLRGQRAHPRGGGRLRGARLSRDSPPLSSIGPGRGSSSATTRTRSPRGATSRSPWTPDLPVRDVEAAVKAAAGAGKVGVVGYCWGGSLTFLAACKLGRCGRFELLRRADRGRPGARAGPRSRRAPHHALRRARRGDPPRRRGPDRQDLSRRAGSTCTTRATASTATTAAATTSPRPGPPAADARFLCRSSRRFEPRPPPLRSASPGAHVFREMSARPTSWPPGLHGAGPERSRGAGTGRGGRRPRTERRPLPRRPPPGRRARRRCAGERPRGARNEAFDGRPRRGVVRVRVGADGGGGGRAAPGRLAPAARRGPRRRSLLRAPRRGNRDRRSLVPCADRHRPGGGSHVLALRSPRRLHRVAARPGGVAPGRRAPVRAERRALASSPCASFRWRARGASRGR